MSKPMKTIGVRFDGYFYQLLQEKADAKGVKISRYIRTLCERALALEETPSSAPSLTLAPNEDIVSLQMISQLNAEILMTLRAIHRRYFEDDDSFKSATHKLYHHALQLLEEIKNTGRDQ